MSRLIDLTGKRFGRLIVVEKAPYKSGCTNARWRCKCDCGNETIVISTTLRNGQSTSCGCYRSEYLAKEMTTHGKCHERIARIWYNMKRRCRCKTDPRYKDYGGRGITICDEWLNNASRDRKKGKLVENGTDCPYNKEPVCYNRKCDTCGWNPAVEKRRSESLWK